jgi:hypothetical protein
MGLPTGIRRPHPFLLRYGPYRLGAWLHNRKDITMNRTAKKIFTIRSTR